MPQNDHKKAIFLISALVVFGGFKLFLSSAAEAFFMSIPIVAIIGRVLFKTGQMVLTRKQMILQAINISFVMIAMIAMFRHTAKLLYGKIIWHEVILCAYFLVAVGILIVVIKALFKLIAQKLSSHIRNTFFQKSMALILVSVFWVFIILPFLLETFAIHRLKIGDRLNPTNTFALAYEDVHFKTKDNVLIHGWFIPGQTDQSVIIGHGLGANKSNFITVADFWHNLGFNVLIFDFRGHGQSQGHTISLGYHERLEIQAGIDYLMTREDIDKREIIGYGVSFGGAAMIQAAAEDPRLKAIIIDSAYADIDSMALKTVERMGFIPPALVKIIARIGLAMASLENGINLQKFSPAKAITQIKKPILLIHGKNDSLIAWQETEKLFAHANQPKFVHFVETQGHYTTMADESYQATITDFLKYSEK